PFTPAMAALLDGHVTGRQTCAFPIASLSVAANCCVPPVFWLTLPGVTATDATGAGAGAAVLPVATFERPPNTAFTLSVPRNAISWKPYAVVRDSPRTVHVRLAPIALPASGVAQVPRATAGAEPHDSGLT